ncbi:hypothetical protein LCGC14_0661580 [marine sediment metagenome]|uniref:Twin-arginine translocation signal domain-containing protein n=1 Tax=marine sediment metagenome TaxID=412755 RepID=A0A0F9QTF3_9ZZZZ
MNRRTFLRSLATVCGAAVMCPGELLKSPIKHLWVRGKDGSYIVGVDRAMKGTSKTVIFIKARQQGCTNNILYGLPRCYLKGVPIYYREDLSA